MKKYVVAAALIVGFASPLLAADNFYIMFDKTAKKCSVNKGTPPTPTSSLA